jgi:hypothetical protein
MPQRPHPEHHQHRRTRQPHSVIRVRPT